MNADDDSLNADCAINSPDLDTTSWPTKPKKGGNLRHKFSKSEDEALRKLVAEHGDSNWAIVAACMKNRTPRQCRERFKNYLSPAIKNGPWTAEEEALLERKFKEIGPKWAKIALHFEQRSDVNVKNHWTAMANRHSRERQLTAEKCDLLQQLDASGRPCCPFPEIFPYARPMMMQQMPVYVGVQIPMYAPHPMLRIMPAVPVMPQVSLRPPPTVSPPEPLVTPELNIPPPEPRREEAAAAADHESDPGLWEAQDDVSFQFDNAFDTSFDLFM